MSVIRPVRIDWKEVWRYDAANSSAEPATSRMSWAQRRRARKTAELARVAVLRDLESKILDLLDAFTQERRDRDNRCFQSVQPGSFEASIVNDLNGAVLGDNVVQNLGEPVDVAHESPSVSGNPEGTGGGISSPEGPAAQSQRATS